MTTTCLSTRRLLSEALDDLLTPERQDEVSEHLAHCQGCHQTYAQMQKIQVSLQGLPAAIPPAELESSIRQIWHPVLRVPPALALYPYLPVTPRWDSIRRLRFAGHLAGIFMTAVGLMLILSFLGRFSLDYDRLSEPGLYSLMNSPSRTQGTQAFSNRLTYREDADTYANANYLAESARLNGYVVNRFADNEMGALHEDSLSVVTQVQPGGRGAIEGILHTPRDRMLFVRFSQLLSTSQFNLPLSQSSSSGRVVWSFCRIIVIS
jgi:hypothetical protein